MEKVSQYRLLSYWLCKLGFYYGMYSMFRGVWLNVEFLPKNSISHSAMQVIHPQSVYFDWISIFLIFSYSYTPELVAWAIFRVFFITWQIYWSGYWIQFKWGNQNLNEPHRSACRIDANFFFSKYLDLKLNSERVVGGQRSPRFPIYTNIL